MTTTLWVLLLAAALIGASFKRLSLLMTAAVTGLILAAAVFGDTASSGFIWTTAIITGVLSLLSQASLRTKFLTGFIFKIYKKILPEMSETEKTALEAGTVWWDGELFSGKPDWNKLLTHPNPTLSSDEQTFIDNEVETLCSMIDEWEIQNNGDASKEVWDFIKSSKFFGMIIPKEYGGLEFSAQAQAAVLQKISALSSSVFSTVGVPNSLGPGELLLKYGTEEQKDHYLPRLADGREIPCFALTGPRAGSDATALPDTGVVCKQIVDGKEVVGIKMNFSKRYITLAPVATVVGMAFRMFDPEGLLGDEEDIGITVALLPRDTKGMDIGKRHMPIGSPFLNGPIFGTDVFIPLDFIIGGPEMRGKGWKMLVECLSVGRCITLPSSGAGGGKYAVAGVGAYARIRRQFNVPVAKLEGVQEALARTAGNAYTAAAAARLTAIAVDQGEIPSVPSAILKYHLTEIARELAIDSMDVHGGRAVMTGPNNYSATGYSSVPVAITVEGANILTRSMIIFGQGAIRCHPYVLPEMQAAEENNLEKFDDALFGHFGFIFSNMSNSLLLSLSNGLLSKAPVSGPTAMYYKKVNRYSASFALMVDMAMFTLGGELKFREITSARLGDMVAKLYLTTMVLKHWEDQGRQAEDLPLVEYACNKLFAEYEEALDKLLQNFPVRPLAWALRAITLPFGRTQNTPSDKLVGKLADLISADTGTRDRLTQGIFRSDNNGKNPIAKYDSLLKRVDRADPLYKALQTAVKKGKFNADELTIEGRIAEAENMGLLSAEDAAFMVEFEKDVLEMVNVDHFESDHFGPMTELHGKKKTKAKKSSKTEKA